MLQRGEFSKINTLALEYSFKTLIGVSKHHMFSDKSWPYNDEIFQELMKHKNVILHDSYVSLMMNNPKYNNKIIYERLEDKHSYINFDRAIMNARISGNQDLTIKLLKDERCRFGNLTTPFDGNFNGDSLTKHPNELTKLIASYVKNGDGWSINIARILIELHGTCLIDTTPIVMALIMLEGENDVDIIKLLYSHSKLSDTWVNTMINQKKYRVLRIILENDYIVNPYTKLREAIACGDDKLCALLQNYFI